MLRLSRRLAFAFALLVPAAASADLIGPGEKPVSYSYSFTVTNLEAFPDWVIVAFPWSMSSGAPTEEATVMTSGKPTQIGTRSPTPLLYAVKKADYAAFAAKHPGPSSSHEWKEMREFVASDKAVKCNAELHLPFFRSDVPPNPGVETFHADVIDETKCAMTPVKTAAPPPSPVDPTDASGPTEATTPPGAGGCASCTVATARQRAAYAGMGLGASLGVALLMRRARRKRD